MTTPMFYTRGPQWTRPPERYELSYKDHVYAVVETPRGSRVKLEFEPKLGAFTLAKPLFAGLTYPYDWGFIPSTKAEDGDPLDVLIIHMPRPIPVWC